ncbi:MAG: branched-chain amino acid ABC transporter permease [Anaerolineae bacterium]|jgi:branched-chain amino acid transport system permease protein|nr:branched-chain amino acid ABC transporter permease [Anaerolineae bacterium]
MQPSPLLQQVYNPPSAAIIMLWVIVWGIIGAVVTPRIYRRKDLDASNARLYGAVGGAGTGPIVPVILWLKTPRLTWWPWLAIPSVVVLGMLYLAFAVYNPTNLCVVNGTYVTTQVVNGLLIGILYGVIALGLTLIFSILGIVSFAHGQFYMIGGYAAFFAINQSLGAGLPPIAGIFLAGIVTMVLGLIFELSLLRPMHLGKVERPGEYAILLTFGLAFFLEYSVLATLGANPRKVDPFWDSLYGFSYAVSVFILAFVLTILLYGAANRYLRLRQNMITDLLKAGISLIAAFGVSLVAAMPMATILSAILGSISEATTITLPPSRAIAAAIGLIILGILLWFLNYTWTGRALRAVSQDKQAAAVVGINPLTMNTLAFGLGAMLAGLSGAALVQVLAWVPNIGPLVSARSFVVIVLGGMGSLPGAMVGGLIIGVVEALGVGCFPDAGRALAYQQVFGMSIFALVLLLKPTGLFGREL